MYSTYRILYINGYVTNDEVGFHSSSINVRRRVGVGVSMSFVPLGKAIGTVRSRTSFILSSQSWEIGRPPTGGAGRMKLSCVVPASVIHIDPFIDLEERLSTSV